MSEAKPQPEPSMEEILASIRRIISEDEQEREAESEAQETVPDSPAEESDVLELTEVVGEEDAPEPEPEPDDAWPPVPASEEEQDEAADEPVEVELRDEPQARQALSDDSGRLVSDPVADASAASLSALAAAVERQRGGPTIGKGDRTIEDLVKEVMRPMIREWLDANLESLVERLVDREIARLSRRAEDGAGR